MSTRRISITGDTSMQHALKQATAATTRRIDLLEAITRCIAKHGTQETIRRLKD